MSCIDHAWGVHPESSFSSTLSRSFVGYAKDTVGFRAPCGFAESSACIPAAAVQDSVDPDSGSKSQGEMEGKLEDKFNVMSLPSKFLAGPRRARPENYTFTEAPELFEIRNTRLNTTANNRKQHIWHAAQKARRWIKRLASELGPLRRAAKDKAWQPSQLLQLY